MSSTSCEHITFIPVDGIKVLGFAYLQLTRRFSSVFSACHTEPELLFK